MKSIVQSILCVSVAWLASSCGLFIGGPAEERRQAYLDPETIESLEVPEDLNKTSIRDALEIPDIETLPTARVYDRKVPRPSPLYADNDPDIIKIQRLGDRSWIILRQTPDMVWPLVQQFMAENEWNVAQEIPDKGILISEPFQVGLDEIADSKPDASLSTDVSDEEEADQQTWQSLIQAGLQSGELKPAQHQIVARIEYGLRRGTAEVHFRYFNGDIYAVDPTDSEFSSTDVEVEKAIVSEFASFNVRGNLLHSSSILVRQLSMSEKSQLVHKEDGQPVLILETDWDRAWATIRQSLRKAEIKTVEEVRDEGELEVLVSDRQLRGKKLDTGLFSRFLPGARVKWRHVAILVKPVKEGHWVEIETRDGKELPVEFSERLLSLLKDLSA